MADETAADVLLVDLELRQFLRLHGDAYAVWNHRDDLRSAGYLAVVETRRRFDDARGVPFAGFARQRIRGAFLDYLRSLDTVSRDHRRNLRTGATDEPPPRLVAETAAADVASADESPEEQLDRLRRAARVREALASLSPKLREFYQLRIVEGKTLSEIAARYGFTEVRACQIHVKMVQRLRAASSAR